jgi:hypothetical protein
MCRPSCPRTRVFATGQGRKTDATDAHSVALVATRMTGLRTVDASHVRALKEGNHTGPSRGTGPGQIPGIT